MHLRTDVSMLICMIRAPVTCIADDGKRCCTLSTLCPLASAVMNIENSVLPSILQKKKESESKQGLNAGLLDQHIGESIANLCTFSSIFSNPVFYRECERIMEDTEEEVAAAVLEYARHRASFNLVTRICHDAAAACPRSVNSTDSEVAKPKKKYLSEHSVPNQNKNGVVKIVAADWMEQVINSTDDVVVLHYHSGLDLALYQKMRTTLNIVSAKIGFCDGLTIGTINLEMNELPSPFGDYIGPNTLCLWRHQDRLQPVRFLSPCIPVCRSHPLCASKRDSVSHF